MSPRGSDDDVRTRPRRSPRRSTSAASRTTCWTRRFQLKWTGRIIFVALAISAIMGVFLYQTSQRGHRSRASKVIAQGEALINESQKNSDLVKMQIKDQYADAPELAATFDKSAARARQAARSRSTSRSSRRRQRRRRSQQQTTMLMSLVAGLTLLVVLHRPARHLLHAQGRGPHLQDEDAASAGRRREAELPGQAAEGRRAPGLLRGLRGDGREAEGRASAARSPSSRRRWTRRKASGASDGAIAKIAHVRDEMKARSKTCHDEAQPHTRPLRGLPKPKPRLRFAARGRS